MARLLPNFLTLATETFRRAPRVSARSSLLSKQTARDVSRLTGRKTLQQRKWNTSTRRTASSYCSREEGVRSLRRSRTLNYLEQKSSSCQTTKNQIGQS